MNFETLNKLIKGDVYLNEPMSKHTYFRIGGPVDCFVIPQDLQDIIITIKFSQERNIPLYIMGNGSNILVQDEGIRGIVLKISNALNYINKMEKNLYQIGAGVLLPRLSKVMAEKGLSGLEFCIGIPGSVGGAVAMNAGAHGCEIADLVNSVKVIDYRAKEKIYQKNDLNFGYRKSKFRSAQEVIIDATLMLQRNFASRINGQMKEYLEKRKRTQPLQYPSAGSIFKKPKNDFAGRLIEAAGCKGMRKSGAMVSDLHANFIVNYNQAKASDVLFLIKKIQRTVYQKFNVYLELEINII